MRKFDSECEKIMEKFRFSPKELLTVPLEDLDKKELEYIVRTGEYAWDPKEETWLHQSQFSGRKTKDNELYGVKYEVLV